MEPEHEWGRFGGSISWGFVGLVVLLGIVLAVSIAIRGIWWERAPIFFFPFLPFGFGIIWLLIIFFAIRWFVWPCAWGYRDRYWGGRDSAYEILRERYASGQLTKEEFEQMRRDLDEASRRNSRVTSR